MDEVLKRNRGGRREGSGRPTTERNIPLLVRISQDAKEKIDTIRNKSEWIDGIIRKNIK